MEAAIPPTEPDDTPVPGSVTVQLAGPGSLGGALIEVDGPITLPAAVPGLQIRSAEDGGTYTVLIYGNVQPGAVFTVDMADTRQVSQVQARILQLADGVTFEQVSPSGWSLSVQR